MVPETMGQTAFPPRVTTQPTQMMTRRELGCLGGLNPVLAELLMNTDLQICSGGVADCGWPVEKACYHAMLQSV